jgi:predicted thioesterase
VLASELEAGVGEQAGAEIAQGRIRYLDDGAASLAYRMRVQLVAVGQVVHGRTVRQVHVVHDAGVLEGGQVAIHSGPVDPG